MADRRGGVVTLPEALAVAGVLAVCLLVPLFPGRLPLARLPVDAITLTMPLALLLSIPLLRRLGATGLPSVGLLATGIVFLGWSLGSVLFSQHVAASLATWSRYVMYFGLVVVVAAATRDWWARRLAMWSLVASGSITCVMGLMQYLNPDSKQAIGLRGLGSDVATRVFATFDNPNFFAEFLLLLFVVTLALALAETGALRWLALVLCSGQALILVLTYTRGSWLALAAGIVVMALLIDARWLWAFFALGAGALAVTPGALRRVLSSFSVEGTASFRLRLWRVTGEIIAAHPVVGVGIGGFVPAFKDASLARPDIATNFLIYGAHNSYYTIAAETGVIGALAFVGVVVTCARVGLYYAPRMRSDRRAFLTNAALTAGLVGFGLNALTSNSFQHPQAAVFFWVIAGLQAGLGAAFWNRAPEPRPKPASRLHAPRWVSDSYIGRGAAVVAAWLPRVWTSSDIARWLTSRPAGGDSILRGSRLVQLLLGQGGSGAMSTGQTSE